MGFCLGCFMDDPALPQRLYESPLVSLTWLQTTSLICMDIDLFRAAFLNFFYYEGTIDITFQAQGTSVNYYFIYNSQYIDVMVPGNNAAYTGVLREELHLWSLGRIPILQIAEQIIAVNGYSSDRQKVLIAQGTPGQPLEEP